MDLDVEPIQKFWFGGVLTPPESGSAIMLSVKSVNGFHVHSVHNQLTGDTLLVNTVFCGNELFYQILPLIGMQKIGIKKVK